MINSYNNWFSLEKIGLYILALILFLLFMREIRCWYWKINDVLQRIESLENKLESQLVNVNHKLQYLCENGIHINTTHNQFEDLSSEDNPESDSEA